MVSYTKNGLELKNKHTYLKYEHGSLVGIATDYGMDGPGIESR
jgi:hypothetical protein